MRRTAPSNVNLNDPNDDLSLRTPDQQLLNLQVKMLLEPFVGQDIRLSADIVNVLGLRTVLTQGFRDGQDFGVALTRQAPFKFASRSTSAGLRS